MCGMPEMFPADAFGDPFALDALPLPRPAVGYGVQRLGTDTLLDLRDGEFHPIRSPGLAPCFATFAGAHAAAAAWAARHGVDEGSHCLAIVPLGYDSLLERHILIYGVLDPHP